MLAVQRAQLPNIAQTLAAQDIERGTCLESTHSQITAPVRSDMRHRFPLGPWAAARITANTDAKRTPLSGRPRCCGAIELVKVKAAPESFDNPLINPGLHERRFQDGASDSCICREL